MTGPKILTWDLETSPNLAHVWSLWDQNVSLAQLRESTRVISFAAKWHGKPGVLFYSDHHDSHRKMVKAAHRLLDEADVLVSFNGRKFDSPHMRREFLEAGLAPPSPFREVDLCAVVKSRFRFPSNKLDYVAQHLGLGKKAKHEGHALWVACMQGDEAAWARMRRYNKRDVVITERLYDRLLPWIVNHPHVGLYSGEDCCQRCGSVEFQRRGYAYTPLGVFAQLRCKKCGSWSRGAKKIDGVGTRGIQ